MKLLLIDYLSPQGHLNFDMIHVKALLSLGHELCLVGREGQFNEAKNKSGVSIIDIPPQYFRDFRCPKLSVRVHGIQCLFWIKRNININYYDRVIFLTYDILSLSLLRLNTNVFLINHNNVDQLDNSIKLFLTKRLPHNYIHIVLNEYMEKRLKSLLPDSTIHLVPHGFLPPSLTQNKPLEVNESERFVFCPVNRNYNTELMSDILSSSSFHSFLKKNNVVLYVKQQLKSEQDGNIKTVGFLDDAEYNYMISNALAVLLPYGDDFKYRCSGIVYECIARNTPVIATNRDALAIYKNRINIDYFDTVENLIIAIKKYITSSCLIYDTNIFQPEAYWKKII